MDKKDLKPNSSLTDLEKLELLYERFLELNHQVYKIDEFETVAQRKQYVTVNFVKFMFDLYDFAQTPQVISDEDYEKLQTQELYRGINKIDYHAQLLSSKKYYISYWEFGNGIFCAPDVKYASSFANSSNHILKFKNIGNILNLNNYRVYFDAMRYGLDLKHVKDEEIKNKCIIFGNFLDSIEDTSIDIEWEGQKFYGICDKQDFLNLMTKNFTTLSTYFGFDSYTFLKINKPTIVINNRAKMMVSLSEYNRICQESENYKHCTKTQEDLTTDIEM